MPAKSFFESARESARGFYASVVRHEVSDANVRGYLRMTSQIEDIWNQVEQKVATLIAQGANPWDAYTQVAYALAFVRAARTHTVFVQELLAADAAADPSTTGFLPHVTYEQAEVLCTQIQSNLERAVMALGDPNYDSDVMLPMQLGPRIESERAPCPLPHLQGMIAAARETRDWAAGLLAQYENTLSGAKVPVPATITAHIEQLKGKLALADVQLRAGIDLVGQISQEGTTPELHEKAEDSLWKAMQGFFLISQTVANPAFLTPRQQLRTQTMPRQQYHDMHVSVENLWELLATDSARADVRDQQLRGITPYQELMPGGEVNLAAEMNELLGKMRGVLSAETLQFLDEMQAAVERGDAMRVLSWGECPFDPVYRTKRSLMLVGTRVPADDEVHWDIHKNTYRGAIEYAKRFGRSSSWSECEGDDE